ncbi:KUP/HAK/KT family potassium transporter [Mesorhizobium sp. KR1-2]|uniref:potassium transporter Kup n=1 Tax=Mesorhizobium sp. KR1-2 TaxID=3156609 RepID=UPI0032B471C7
MNTPDESQQARRSVGTSASAALGLSALGVVFGDIGTSPLYTLKTVLALAGGRPAADVTLGVLSLVFWTLIIIVSIKYVSFAMRADNDGEGGILALMALLGVKRHQRPAIVALGLFGAALIYGDGAITPAISVLSALEGLNIAVPAAKSFVVPASVAILVVLFAIQPLGTALIGRAFGPIMALWFLTIGLLGLWGVLQHPSVLVAIDPRYALRYLFSGDPGSFLVLGGVFLCVTGAEALYADMGHFGARPIRLAWSVIVFPSLLLNYAGQTAIVLEGAPTQDNIFYRLCPEPLLIPLVLLATLATIIASQSIITGAFSMSRQAILLGWLPRLWIVQTSAEGYGQIYVGVVNWMLMIVTVGLTIVFGKSDNLAAAYGIAVSLTMLMTSALLFIAMREVWGWSLVVSGMVAGFFLVVDSAFFLANVVKVLEGGYVPLLLAAGVYGLMFTWHKGAAEVSRRLREKLVPVAQFMEQVKANGVPRVPGTAVFLTKTACDTPPVMVRHVERNRALHEHLLALTVEIQSIPRIKSKARLSMEEVAPNFWRAIAQYGFMERPDIPALLRQAQIKECGIGLDDVTYYIGRETVISRDGGNWLANFQKSLFALMERNSAHVTDFLRVPTESVVEIGRQVAI